MFLTSVEKSKDTRSRFAGKGIAAERASVIDLQPFDDAVRVEKMRARHLIELRSSNEIFDAYGALLFTFTIIILFIVDEFLQSFNGGLGGRGGFRFRQAADRPYIIYNSGNVWVLTIPMYIGRNLFDFHEKGNRRHHIPTNSPHNFVADKQGNAEIIEQTGDFCNFTASEGVNINFNGRITHEFPIFGGEHVHLIIFNLDVSAMHMDDSKHDG